MRIGVVTPSTPSYSETFFNSKIKKLKEAGFNIILFANNINDYSVTKVVSPLKSNVVGVMTFIYYFFLNTRKFIKFYNKEKIERKSNKRAFKNLFLNAHILKHKLDWLYFGYATMTIQRELVCEVLGAKMAVSFRGYDINVYPLKNDKCYNLLWTKVDKVHSISKDLLKKAYLLGLNSKTKYQIINPAVDLNKLNEIKKENKKITHNTNLKIVTIARLNWVKGVQYSIVAMKYLLEEGINFEYKIIGGGNKHEFEYLRFLIKELKLQKRVSLEGKLSHDKALDLLEEADIYLQPSIEEGFCNSVLEAQAKGKLCVVTNAGGMPENIINNKTGIIVEKINSYELFKGINKIITMSEKDKNKMKNMAVNNVKNNFTIEKQQKEFIKFYTN